MTTLYKPVLIESAAQAEALSEGAVVINRDSGDKYHRGLDGTWWSDHDMGGPLSMDLEHDTIEALVPIEAEEEWAVRYDDPDEGAVVELHIDEEHARAWAYSVDGAARSRLVTPWTTAEEA